MTNWISVDTRLPEVDPDKKGRYKDGEVSIRVLCACKQHSGKMLVKEGYYEKTSWGDMVWRIPGSIDSVTHWMYLPEPPVEECNNMNKQEQFINQIKDIKNYWLSQPNKTTEEAVDGVLFSLLVMIDGDSGMNDFHALEIFDTKDGQQIDCGYLHEFYYR